MPKEIGGSSDIVSGGFIFNDYNTKLQFPQSIEIYDEMRKGDTVVNSGLSACKLPLLSASYEVQPASDDERDIEIAEFTAKVFGIGVPAFSPKMSWVDFLRHCLLMYDFGFMYFEEVLQTYDDVWSYKKLAPRLPATILKFTTKDSKPGIEQTATINPFTPKEKVETVSIPQRKLFHIAYNQEGDNLTGVSMLRAVYKPWFYKETTEKIQAIGIERHGTGIPRARVTESGSTLSDKEKKQIESTLSNMRANSQSRIITTYGVEVDYLTIDGDLPDIDKPIERYSREIAIGLQSKFLTTGISNGSFGQSKNETDFLSNAIKGNIDYILEKVNNQLVKRIVDLNFENVEKYPKIVVTDISNIDLGNFSLAIERLSKSGLNISDLTTQNIIRRNLKLPTITQEQFDEEQEKKEQAEMDQQKQFEEKQNPKEEKKVEKKDSSEKEVEKEIKEEKMSRRFSKSITEKEFVSAITKNEDVIKKDFAKVQKDFNKTKDVLKKFIKAEYKKANVKDGHFTQDGNSAILKAISDKSKEEYKKLREKYGQKHGKKINEEAYNRGAKIVKLKGNTSWSTRGYLFNIGKVFDRAATNIIERVNDQLGTMAIAAVAFNSIDNIVNSAVNENDLRLSYETYPRSSFKQAVYEENISVEDWKMVVPEGVIDRFKVERPNGFTMDNVFKIGTVSYWASKRDDENGNPLIFPIHHNSQDYYLPITQEEKDEQEALSREQRKSISNLSSIYDNIELAKKNKDRKALKENLNYLYHLHKKGSKKAPTQLSVKDSINEYVDSIV